MSLKEQSDPTLDRQDGPCMMDEGRPEAGLIDSWVQVSGVGLIQHFMIAYE